MSAATCGDHSEREDPGYRCAHPGYARYTVELASQKARTSAGVGVPTGVIEAMQRAGAGHSREPNAGRGGVPVQYKGQCAGAVGVSGAKPEIDLMIAQTGIALLNA